MTTCAKFARRLVDWQRHPSPRVHYRLVRDWPLVAKQLSMDPDLWTNIESDPAWGSELISLALSKLRAKTQTHHVRKWQRSLMVGHSAPSGHLYRWLRAEAGSPPLVLDGADGRIEGLPAVFDAHRTFCETVSSSVTHEEDRTSILNFLATPNPSWTQKDDVESLMAIAKSFPTKTAGGLDAWPSHTIRFLSYGATSSLLQLYRHSEKGGGWPAQMLEIRVALIPKPESNAMKIENWRPISLTSVLYRLYPKWRLQHVMPLVLPNLSSGVVGGLPGLRCEMEILELATMPETLARGAHVERAGITMDATKCFDKVPWPSALQVCLASGMPRPVLISLFDMYLHQKRHTTIRGCIDTNVWNLQKGILQGCPLSVLVLCCLVSSWHSCLDELGSQIRAVSFVDDRLLVANTIDCLERAWNASLVWDTTHQWHLNPPKSAAFSVGLPDPALWCQDLVVPVVNLVRYLGVEIPFGYNLPRTLLTTRAHNALAALQRVAQLPNNLLIDVRARAIEVAAIPKWAYGIVSSPPPLQLIGKLTVATKRALWSSRKAMHAFPMVAALVFRPHRLSPWGALVYNHVTYCVRALHQRQSELVDATRDLPSRLRARGPVQVMFTFLAQCGFIRGDGWVVTDPSVQDFNLVDCDIRAFAHSLRQGIRRALIALATKRRPNLRGSHLIDIDRTVKIFRRKHHTHLSELVTLVSDGLWQGQRRFHAGKRPSQGCPHCGNDCEDTVHVLWHCPKWQSFRVVPETLVPELLLNQSSAACGICSRDFSEALLAQWENVQRQCAHIIRAHQEGSTLEMGKPKPLLETPRGEVAPHRWSSVLWSGSRVIRFSVMALKNSRSVSWQYGDSNWNRIIVFLSRLRIASAGQMPSLERISLLELVASYIVMNGGTRFYGGIPDSDSGGRVTIQLDRWHKALVAFSALAECEPLVPALASKAETTDRFRVLGLPRQILLSADVLIPNAVQVSHLLSGLSGQLPTLTGKESQGAELWRRLVIGEPESQTNPDLRSIPAIPLAWLPPRRLRTKQPAKWIRQMYEGRNFVSRISSLNDLSAVLAGLPLEIHLQRAGVCSPQQLLAFGKRSTQRAKRLRG